MKTKEQIIRQLRLYKFSDEEWKKVSLFCKSHYGPGIQKYYSGKIDCDYEQFMDWYENGLGSGDFVRVGKTVAIISYAVGSEVAYSAYFDMDDNLVYLDGATYKAKEFNGEKLSEELVQRYRNILNRAGYRICVISGIVDVKTPLRIGQMRRFWYQDKYLYGIVKERNTEGGTFCFGYCEDDFVRGDIFVLKEDIHDVIDGDLATKIESDVASRYHIRWDRPTKKLCLYSARTTWYYYLTDKFTITRALDNHNKLSNTRYEMGNYFISMEDAVAFLNKLKVLRSDMIDNGEIK